MNYKVIEWENHEIILTVKFETHLMRNENNYGWVEIIINHKKLIYNIG